MLSSSLTNHVVVAVVYLSAFQTTLLRSVECHSVAGRFQNSRFKRGSSEIVFYNENEKNKDCSLPEQEQKVSDRFGEGTRDPCPNSSHGFCETVDNYPTDQIKDLLKKKPSLLDNLYVEDITDTDVNRFGDDTVSKLCPTKTRLIYPQKAKSREDVYEFVVNDGQHRQGVRVEECVNEGKECEIISNNLPFGYKSFCEQKYVTRTLVVAEAKDGGISGIVTKPFDIPSCCSCSLRMIHDRFSFQSPGQALTPKRNSTATTGALKRN